MIDRMNMLIWIAVVVCLLMLLAGSLGGTRSGQGHLGWLAGELSLRAKSEARGEAVAFGPKGVNLLGMAGDTATSAAADYRD